MQGHADVVFFWSSQEKWWSKKFGDLDEAAKLNLGKFATGKEKKAAQRKPKQVKWLSRVLKSCLDKLTSILNLKLSFKYSLQVFLMR